MGDHEAIPVRSTQEANPGRAVLRTILAVLPAVAGLVAFLPDVLNLIVTGYGDMLPPQFRLVLLGIAAFIVTTVGICTKILALPRVNEWLRKYVPAAAPDAKPPVD